MSVVFGMCRTENTCSLFFILYLEEKKKELNFVFDVETHVAKKLVNPVVTRIVYRNFGRTKYDDLTHHVEQLERPL